MQPDSTILLSAQRYAGANIHDIANLQETYILACYADDLVLAASSKHELYQALLANTL